MKTEIICVIVASVSMGLIIFNPPTWVWFLAGLSVREIVDVIIES